LLYCTILYTLICGCSRTDKLVFIVADNYKGVLKLETKRPGAPDLTKSSGEYVIEFPESGIVSIRNQTPLQRWHTTSARYHNGKGLQVVTDGAGDSNAVAFRYVGSGKTNVDWFVIGTFEDLKKAMEKKNGGRVPFESHY